MLTSPAQQKIQPIGFLGRREATQEQETTPHLDGEPTGLHGGDPATRGRFRSETVAPVCEDVAHERHDESGKE